MTDLRTVLAVDAGNSKTDAVLLTGDGAVLGRRRGGGFQPYLGRAAALAAVAELIGSVLTAAGVSRVDLLFACLANSDLPAEDDDYARWLSGLGVADDVRVRNDAFALLRSATSAPAAVAVVCGAGMNCVGVGPGGAQVRFLALGTFTGDWGGGETLGQEAMFHAVRDEDGRAGRTQLTRAVAAHFGLASAHEVAVAVHRNDIDMRRLHELVPVLFAVAAAGDAIATAVVQRQADEVVAFALAALRRLDLLDVAAPVVLGGGVLAAQHEVLMTPIHRALAQQAPQATVVVPQSDPIVGAALLGLEELSGGPVPAGIEQRATAEIAAAGRLG
jgi:N-acetylglucosamine kinase-like BadF-type ATPase